ncbi:MAG: hypothetical protein PUJ71_10040, partial [Clostridiales bacterium]|nr:hypothetical protein [Clostridiales bacterium]
LHQKTKDSLGCPLFFDEHIMNRTPSSPAMPGLDHALRQVKFTLTAVRRAKPGSASPRLHQKRSDSLGCHFFFDDEHIMNRTPSSPADWGLIMLCAKSGLQ